MRTDFDLVKYMWYRKARGKFRTVSGFPPLTYKAKKAGTLKNYRIYGNTVNGGSVGDRTANLIQGSIKNANIGNNGKINTSNEFILVYAPVVTGESYTISNNNGTNVYAFYNAVPSAETATSYDSSRQVFSTSTITFVSPTTGYIAVRLANTAQDIMINPGSTAVPYEPVGYRVPVTVNDVTTDLCLPEQLRMVGTEADYIDYGEQKQHRVRKNLWDGEIESGSWLGFNDDEPYKVDYNLRCRSSKLIAVKNSSVYTISNHEPSTNVQVLIQYRDNNKKFINEYGWADFPCTFTTPSNAAFIEFIIRKPSNLEIMPEDCGDIQLELGSTATEYEPYIENTEVDVTLPALPTLSGTNTLTVGTEVQPSSVEIKGRIKAARGD